MPQGRYGELFLRVQIPWLYYTMMAMSKLRLSKRMWVGIGIGFIVGALVMVGIRFFTIKSDDVHYHANFGLYVNGVRDEFKNFTFYEEVQSCDQHDSDNPKTLVHLHDNNNHVVHVHAHAVTWSQFFANLGYGLNDKVLTTDKGVYVDGAEGMHLTFWLNGQAVDGVANRVIASRDVLLVSYGDDNQAILQKQYNSIPKDAQKFNEAKDPTACGGADQGSFTNRLKAALGFETH